MVNGTNSYQPSAAYQGERVNVQQQEAPKSGQTQPKKEAPSADTQHADNDSARQERGKTVNVKA